MAVNKRKILEAARKFAQKGAKDRALKEYEKLLKLDPRDAKLRLEIGDAHRRWGQLEEAISTYTKVAEQYTAEGFDARAVAVYKQIQTLDAERWTTYEPLAELYQRMGLTSEAIHTLQAAADGYHRAGERRQALEVLRRMSALDPTNTPSRLKVADLLRQDGFDDEAIVEYQGVAEELERQGEADEAVSVLEKVLEIQPEHVATLVSLARGLVGRGLGGRAEPYARRAVDADAEVPDHYELLAECYRQQQREDKLGEVYRGLAELYRRRGDEDRAREITQRFATPSEFAAPPSNGDLVEQSDFESELEGDVSSFLEEDDQSPETLLEDELLEEPSSDPPLAAPSPLAGAEDDLEELEEVLDESPPPELEVEAEEPLPTGDPDQLLAEAGVYLRYGKREQAIANLKGILAQDDRHRGALEKLGEAWAESGDNAQAVELWLRAAHEASSDGDDHALSVLHDRIHALDPEAAAGLPQPEVPEPEIPEPSEEEGYLEVSQPVAAVADVPDTAVDLDDDIEIDVDDPDDLDHDLGEEIPAAPQAAAPAPAKTRAKAAAPSGEAAGASSSTSQRVLEEIEEAEFYLEQGLLDEAEAIYQRLVKIAPNHPQVLVRLGEIAAARGNDPAAPETAAPAPVADAGEADDELVDADEWSDAGFSATEELEISEGPGASETLEAPAESAAAEELEAAAALEVEPAAEDAPRDPAGDTPVQMSDELEEPELEEPELEEPVAAAKPPAPEPAPTVASDTPVLADAQPEAAAAAPAAEDSGVGTPQVTRPPIDEIEPGDTGTLPPVPDEMAQELEVPTPAAESGDYDLAAELSGVFDPDPQAASSTVSNAGDSFAAVFREFKKGVSKQLSESDHEAHYDLGIAYREMGLLDDAVQEFSVAMASPARRVSCLQMLAQCHLEMGRADVAVNQLQEAVADPSLTPEAQLPIRFDLGCAFEAVGDRERARTAWEQVAAVDPSFGDVEQRLTALDEGRKPPGLVPDGGGFESFDDVIEAVEADDAPGADEPVAVVEAEPEPEPAEPEPAPAAPAAPDPATPDPDDSGSGRRKRKKISFV